MSTGNLNDGLIALKDGKMIVLRVPYPLGFYAKGFDGRIDDPSAGWKGRGLWTTSGEARRGSRKAAKAPSRSPCTSSSGRTRSLTDERVDDGGSACGAAPKSSRSACGPAESSSSISTRSGCT